MKAFVACLVSLVVACGPELARSDPSSFADSLAAEVYAHPSLVPASPWLGGDAPGRPRISLQPGEVPTINLAPAESETAWLWVVRARYGTAWTLDVVPGGQATFTPVGPVASAVPDVVAVSVVDRLGLEGPVAVLRR